MKHRTVAILLASWCLGLSAASALHADTLSDNLSAAPYYTETASSTSWVAASFGIGASPYTLTSASLLLSSSSGTGAAELDLYSNSNAQPQSFLGALVSPSAYGPSPSVVTFRGSNLPLAAQSTYWLVLKAQGENVIDWAYTLDNSGSGSGFQHTWGVSSDGGATWYTSDLEPMLLRVDAQPSSAVPEPGSLALMTFASGILLLFPMFLGWCKASAHAQS